MAHRIIPGSPGPAPLLVGREPELVSLREQLGAARTGRGSLALIGGEAGIGKTALAERLCREAEERGSLVLIGRCYDLTETPPYGPWIDLFAHYRQADGMPPLPESFARRGTVGAVSGQGELFQQVLDFFTLLATPRPIVVLLDDLHWADPASLDLLRFLARSLATMPDLLIATYRHDELTRRHPLYHLLPTLVRESAATRLDLRRIEPQDIRALIAARYTLPERDAVRLAAYLDGRSEGNPFFLGELLRTLEAEHALRASRTGWSLGDLAEIRVPALLRQVIDARLARLDDEAQRLLAVASVIGQEVPLKPWTAVAECDEEMLPTAVEQAAEAQLIVVSRDGASIQFAHALIREALYEGIPPLRRRTWHRRAGEVLIERPNPDPDAAAYHFRAAGDVRAYGWLIRAGDRAQRAYAWLTAADRFETALALAEERGIDARERAWLLMRLAAMVASATPARAAQIVAEVAQRAEGAGDRGLAAYATFRQGYEMGQAGNTGGRPLIEAGSAALDALTEDERAQLLADAARFGVPDVVAEARSMLVAAYGGGGRLADAVRMGELLLERETNGFTYVGLAIAYDGLGMPERSRAMWERARAANTARGDYTHIAFNDTSLLTLVLQYDTENLAERQRLVDAAMAAGVRASGTRPVPPRIYALHHLVVAGQWDEVRQVGTAIEAGADMSWFIRFHAGHALLRVWAETGESEQAWDLIRRWLPEGPARAVGSRQVRAVVPVQQIAARLALAAGDLPAAKEWLEAADHWQAWSGAVRWRSEVQTLWAAYHRAAGDRTAAEEHARQALAHATEPRQPLALLAAHRLLGELATDAGRFDAAISHLDTALALADACAAPYERALTLLARAALRIDTNKRDEASALLDEVRAICAPLGTKPALARADALAAKPATESKPVSVYPAGLSAREVEVLRLVAEGMTNAQVAERLFLSPHTINSHLTTIYNKLGVPSRSAAIRFAIEHGLR